MLPTTLLLLTLTAPPDGPALYKAQCARCHGGHGEGAKKYAKPLQGDLSVAQLGKLVRETMPEDNPNSLTEAESLAIAGWMHDRFYSAVARERVKPARIDLTRLTVAQYRNAVADLVGSFRTPIAWGNERGLNGEYFNSRGIRRDKRVLERLDAQVQFDFGTGPAIPDKMEPHDFSIAWSGSVLPPESGDYEFVVRTEHAVRLWVNDLEQSRPLVDAWVKSGNDTEFRGTIPLLAGRPTGIRLEYSKSKQGVQNDPNKDKKPPVAKSSIALLWKRPHGVVEVIPARQLSPQRTAEQFVVTAKFPPDDRSLGWERGSSVSKEWDAAATEAAIETAGYLVRKVNELAGTNDNDKDRPAKLRKWCETFAERAFRRPLTAEQKAIVVDKSFALPDPKLAVQRVVLMVLKSPFFLYREVGGTTDDFDTASRLSFALWDSMPDEPLRRAAAAGQLKTADQRKKQAERMLADPRAKAKLRGFLLTWLHADQPHDLQKDAKRFPGFDAALIADLKTSLEIMLDETVQSDASDFRTLLTSTEIYANDRIAHYFQLDAPKQPGFAKVKFGERRAGVLTHPYLLASFAGPTESSPIHRGVFLARGVLGVSLKPPPEAVAPVPPDLHPGLTTRERVALQTKAANCMTCHGIINPLGFTLEQFDAVGRFRDTDAGKPIDAKGEYLAANGKVLPIDGARSLAMSLVASPDAHEAFVEQLFHHLAQQPIRAYGPTTLDDLERDFRSAGFSIRKLAAAAAVTAAAAGRK
jgi:hypothetical protein